MTQPTEQELVAKIAEHYYGSCPKIEAINSHNHHLFRLNFADSCKIIKLSSLKEDKLLEKELRIIDFLQKKQFNVPLVEYRKTTANCFGKSFFIMNSSGRYTVSFWMNKNHKIAQKLFFKMGHIFAKLHNIKPVDKSVSLVKGNQFERQKYFLQKAKILVKKCLISSTELSLLELLPLPNIQGNSLCHGDFHGVQCITKDEKISAVVDWENAWIGNPWIDVAITHAYLDYYCPSSLIKSFFTGYNAINQLPENYSLVYLPVRIIHLLGLIKVFSEQSWKPNLERALKIFRSYCGMYQTALNKNQGGTSNIISWKDNNLLKLYYSGISSKTAYQEAKNTKEAEELGIRVPRVKNVVTINDRPGIILESIPGQTMLDILCRNPNQAVSLAKELAKIHVFLHSKLAKKFPSQRQSLITKLNKLKQLSSKEKYKVLKVLNDLPEDNRLCHGDFQPQNILINNNELVVIDWLDGTQGHPLADVARTLLLLGYGQFSLPLNPQQRQNIKSIRYLFYGAYLQQYHSLNPLNLNLLRAWEIPILVTRLSEKLSPEELNNLTILTKLKLEQL